MHTLILYVINFSCRFNDSIVSFFLFFYFPFLSIKLFIIREILNIKSFMFPLCDKVDKLCNIPCFYIRFINKFIVKDSNSQYLDDVSIANRVLCAPHAADSYSSHRIQCEKIIKFFSKTQFLTQKDKTRKSIQCKNAHKIWKQWNTEENGNFKIRLNLPSAHSNIYLQINLIFSIVFFHSFFASAVFTNSQQSINKWWHYISINWYQTLH